MEKRDLVLSKNEILSLQQSIAGTTIILVNYVDHATTSKANLMKKYVTGSNLGVVGCRFFL